VGSLGNSGLCDVRTREAKRLSLIHTFPEKMSLFCNLADNIWLMNFSTGYVAHPVQYCSEQNEDHTVQNKLLKQLIKVFQSILSDNLYDISDNLLIICKHSAQHLE
jgi:hypothetical protein